MDSTIAGWGIGVGVTVLLMLIAKFAPKKKLMKLTGPMFYGFGIALSKVLSLRLGEKLAEKVEDGVFKTIVDVIKNIADQFWFGLSKDNKENKK